MVVYSPARSPDSQLVQLRVASRAHCLIHPNHNYKVAQEVQVLARTFALVWVQAAELVA